MDVNSVVIIRQIRDGRGPVTSNHLRNFEAFIDGKEFGSFADKPAAEKACQIATLGRAV